MLFFKSAVLLDDLGWIVKDIKESSLHAGSRMESDFYLFNMANYGKAGLSSVFYQMSFYMEKNYDQIQRSYMKFQELSALVGGFMKIIMFGGQIITMILTYFDRDELIYNDLFEYKLKYPSFETQSVDTTKKVISSPVKSFKSPNLKFDEKYVSIEDAFSPKHGVKINHNNVDKQDAEKISFYSLKMKKWRIPSTKNNLSFGMAFHLRRIFCSKCLPAQDKRVAAYLFLDNYLKKRMDITYYLKNTQTIDRLRLILLKYHQNIALEFPNRPNLADQVEMKKLQIDNDIEIGNIRYS